MPDTRADPPHHSYTSTAPPDEPDSAAAPPSPASAEPAGLSCPPSASPYSGSIKDTVAPPPVEHPTPPGFVSYEAAKEHRGPQKVLKTVLLVAALLSLAQVCAAIALKIVGRTYSIDVLDSPDNRVFNSLPAVMSVTTYTLQVWLGAAMALWGLWLWNRQLRRDGMASYDDMAGWGALIASRASDIVLKSETIGVPVAATYAVLMVFILLASSGVVDSVTLAAGERTIAGWYGVPTLVGTRTGTGASSLFGNSDETIVVYTALDASISTYNSSAISIGGALVVLDDLGLANPGVLQSFTGASTLRKAKDASDTSFVEASMCMAGITANTTCTPVYDWSYSPVSANRSEAITLNHTDACGRSQEASLAAEWGLDASPCWVNQSSHFTWITANYHQTSSAAYNITQINCAVNLAIGSEWMTVYRRNGQTGVERAAVPDGVAPCVAPANLSYPWGTVTNDLNYDVSQSLAPGLNEPSISGVLSAAARNTSASRWVYVGDGAFADHLAGLTSLLYRATYTTHVVDLFQYDNQSQAIEYGLREDGRGIVTETRETYKVAALGEGNKWYLGFLFPTAVVILLSLRLHRPAVRVFDPSDPAAVARVVLQQAPIQTEADLEEGGKRLRPPYTLLGGSWTKA